MLTKTYRRTSVNQKLFGKSPEKIDQRLVDYIEKIGNFDRLKPQARTQITSPNNSQMSVTAISGFNIGKNAERFLF